MEEKAIVTTRFICIDSRNEYHMKWHKKITDTNPLFTHNGKLSFAIVGTKGRMEVNTLDMNYLESCAKLMTVPKGRSSVSSDKAYIYIKEKDEKGNLIIYKTMKNGEVSFNFPNEGILLSPLGKKGPFFITYPNFNVIKKWNKSDLYALSVGILADEIMGRKTYDINNCQTHHFFTRKNIMKVQICLEKDKLYTGEIDGVDGPLTKEAVTAYQLKHNLLPDGYLSEELLEKLFKTCQKEKIGEKQ